MPKKPKEFTFYWRDGKRDVFPGKDAAECLNNAGYGQGALKALDFWHPGDDTSFKWNADLREWMRIVPLPTT